MPDAAPPSPAELRRVCYFAHYDPEAIVGDHVLHYLRALRDAGFVLLIGTPCPLPPAERAKLEAVAEHVLVRDNIGMDFGTWIDLLARFPPGEDDLVLLANDSVYAPIGDLAEWIDKLLSVPADMYGAVASGELRPHLQSWFVLLRPSAHQSAVFRQHLRPGAITPASDKSDIVDRFELGLTAALVEAGLQYHASYDWRRDSRVATRLPFNPMHLLWDDLIRARVLPFLKVELLRYNPAQVDNLSDWRDLVGELQPALLPMIEADQTRRGATGAAVVVTQPTVSGPRLGPDPIYRRQLRPMVVRDFRAVRADRRADALWNAVKLHLAWQYARAGRVAKWWARERLASRRRARPRTVP